MSNARLIVKNLFSLSVAEGVSRLVGFLLITYIGKSLGETALGELSIAVAITSYFALFSDFGLSTLGIKEISKNNEDTNKYGSNILAIQIVISVIMLLFLLLMLPYLPYSSHLKLLIILFSLSIFPSALNLSYALQAREKMGLVAIVKIISQIGYAAIGAVFVFYGQSIDILPVIQLIVSSVACVLAFLLAKRYIQFSLNRLDGAFILQLVKQATPFVTTALMIQLYNNADTIMIGAMQDEAVAGYYNAAYKTMLLAFGALALINGATFPTLSRLSHRRDILVKAIKLIAKYLGTIAVPTVVIGIILAKPILFFLFNDSFLPSVPVFQILIVYIGLKFLSANYEWAVIIDGGIKEVAIAVTCAAIINIALNLVLIPKFGILGAAWATIASEAASVVLQGYYFKRRFVGVVFEWDYFLKPIIATLPVVAVLLVLPADLHIVIRCGLAAVVYGVGLLLCKGISIAEVMGLATLRR